MHRLFLLLVGCSLQLVGENCPFLNAATAAGVVGGPVHSSFVSSNKDDSDGTCQFVGQQQTSKTELRIEVETMTDRPRQFNSYLARCGSKSTHLPATGNEAVECTRTSKDGQQTEQIIGRVRDRAFVIQLSSNDPARTADLLREKARVAAEQVSGFLF
jgi:hypothetical protein